MTRRHSVNLLPDEHAERAEHAQCGYHKTHNAAFVNGHLEETVLPDFATEIDLKNGWHDTEDAAEGLRLEQFAEAGEALNRLLAWLVSGKRTTLETIGRRCVALCQAVAPQHLGNVATRQLGEQFKCTAQGVSKYSAQIFDLANGHFVSRNCRPADERKSWAQAHIGKTSRPYGTPKKRQQS